MRELRGEHVVDLLNADAVVIEQPALARMEEVYS